ncbi:MAG: rhombosortase [Deferrisomatales bacterium]
MSRLPWLTGLLAVGCLGVGAAPGLGAALLWDRQAIWAGEPWRLVTGLLVHLSPGHLGWDLLVLALAGSAAELRSRPRYAAALALTALATGPLLLALHPDLARFGGSSGLATAAACLLAFEAVRAGGAGRALGLAALGLVAAKLAAEWAAGAPLLVADAPFRPVPSAHLVGAVAAAAAHLLPRRPAVSAVG